VASPQNFDNLIRLFSSYEQELKEKDNLVVKLFGRDINIGLDYLKDLKGESADEIFANFKKPIIMFHSLTDKVVPYEQGINLFNKINSEKSFISLNNVDHLVSNKKHSDYISNILYTWLENFSNGEKDKEEL
jgi:putative redox protein